MYTVLTLSLFFAASILINVWQLIRSWQTQRTYEIDRLEFQAIKTALQDYVNKLENENRVLHIDVQNLSSINSKLTEPQPLVQATTITETNVKKKSSRKTKTL